MAYLEPGMSGDVGGWLILGMFGTGGLAAGAVHWWNRRPRPRRARLSLRIVAAAHEIRCAECRVSWSSWARRLSGRDR